MSSKTSVPKQLIRWLLPSALEIYAYAILALVTLLLSNIAAIQKFFMVAHDFDLRLAVLNSIEAVLARLLGQSAAAALITAVFWGLIGMLVYILLWLLVNYSTEFTNDLAISRYMHPKGSNALLPLISLILKIFFQFIVAIVLLFYLNFLIQGLAPLLTESYAKVFDNWPHAGNIYDAATALAGQVVSLHLATVLIRLLVLRKRVFGSDWA